MKKLLIRAWDSPTLTTWFSFATRAGGLLLLTPIILNRFDVFQVNVWYLLLTLISLQMLADFGFSPSFSRAIAYALGGAAKLEKTSALREIAVQNEEPNWALLTRILATMRKIYSYLGFGAVALLGIGGTLALLRPISALAHPLPAWGAWGVVLCATFVTFRGNFLVSYLQGINQIALLRRWEAVWTCLGLGIAAGVAWLGANIFWVILSSQLFAVINVIWNSAVARGALDGKLRESAGHPFDQEVFEAVWPAAWRSGLGVLMSNGVIQATSLVFAQLAPAAEVASFLLAMRLMQAVVQFSQAPFYSKIPLMARKYAQGDSETILKVATRGMRLSYVVFLSGVLFIGFGIYPLLVLIHSKTTFVEPSFWFAMSLAFFIERMGAMNMQLYSLSNHIIWHIANGITGVIYILLCILTVSHWGIWGFPFSMGISYLLCYTSYSLIKAHGLFKIQFFRHELGTGALPAAALLLLLITFSTHFTKESILPTPQLAKKTPI